MNYYTTNSNQKYSNIKIEYHNALDSGRIVSQIYPDASGKPPTQVRKIITHFVHNNSTVNNEINNAYNETSEINFRNNNMVANVSQHKEQQVLDVDGNDNIHNNHHLIKTENDLLLSYHNNSMTKLLASTSELEYSNSNSNDNDYDACTDGNLSWLLNYKIHELPELPDSNEINNNFNASNQNQILSNHKLAMNASNSNDSSNVNLEQNIIINNDITNNLINSAALITLMGNNGSLIQQEQNKGLSNGPKKPPFTYTELIEHALIEKGELTVSGIYQWISDHFPFYKQNDDRWKNSVRHNLSINPHFRKGGKAVHGAGHLWTIAQKDEKKTWQIRQKMQDFIKASQKNLRLQQQEEFDKELQAATESILGEIQAQTFVEVVNKNDVNIVSTNNSAINEKIMENQNLSKSESNCIEVEYINLTDGAVHGLEDFLSPPVSKQEIVNECGLGSDFFITDINPAALGLNLATNGEAIVGSHMDRMYDDEMSFVEYYDMKE